MSELLKKLADKLNMDAERLKLRSFQTSSFAFLLKASGMMRKMTMRYSVRLTELRKNAGSRRWMRFMW